MSRFGLVHLARAVLAPQRTPQLDAAREINFRIRGSHAAVGFPALDGRDPVALRCCFRMLH